MALDPNKPRDAVIAAGRDRLLRHGIDSLRSQLNASVLSGESPVSRDTAYRVFRGDPTHANVTDAIVAEVSRAANDPTWTGYYDAISDTIAAFESGVTDDGDPVATVIASLQANFEAQFRSAGLPVTWALQAAAFTASEAWEGEPPQAEDVPLARELLEHRRGFYEDVTRQLVSFLTLVMSQVGRRPRADMEPETIVFLLHALHDGAVLRRLIDPDALSPELVGEAMYRLAEAFTEEGPLTDPRRPDDQRNQRLFDRLLEAAHELWRTKPEVTVDAVAEHAAVPPEAASLLFPTVGDLVDSLIRSRVVGGGFADLGPLPDEAKVGQRLVALISELRSLRAFADELPNAMAAVHAHRPTRSSTFEDDFVDNESRVVGALGVTPRPDQFVRDLLSFASQGTPGWPSVTALLRTIGHDPD